MAKMYEVVLVGTEDRFQVDDVTRARIMAKASGLVETTVMQRGKWIDGPSLNVQHVLMVRAGKDI